MEAEYLGVSKRTKEILEEIAGGDPSEISMPELLKALGSNAGKLGECRRKMEMSELQGVAQYATMFAEMLNDIKRPDGHELPYALIGMQTAVRTLKKQMPDKIVSRKIADLEQLCKTHLVSHVTEERSNGE